MKMSKLALSTQKSRMNSDECLSLRILLQSGLLYRYGSGIYGKHNLLVKAQQNIESIIRSELDSNDCVEISLPTLQPKSIWEESGRWSKYANSNQMFYCDMSNGTFCLAPTAEEATVAFAKDHLKSYKSLPSVLYQIGSKYRNEIRVRGGLLRSKEFTMMDAYSFHTDSQSLKEEYLKMKEIYFTIFSLIGLNVIPVAAVNGEMGGTMSEEFMFISDAGEDTILVNKEETIGLNTEVLEMENSKDYLFNNYGISDLSGFEIKHCIELGHIFQLGQKYSLSMNGFFTDASGSSSPYYMGCYGIGISRALAAICEQNCDENGLIWPKKIAPYKVSIIYQNSLKNQAFDLYNKLNALGIDVLIDDRNASFGSKIKDSKLIGIPYMVIIGKSFHNDNLYEVENRASENKSYVTQEELISMIK